jgi:hypothetical protein
MRRTSAGCAGRHPFTTNTQNASREILLKLAFSVFRRERAAAKRRRSTRTA